MTTYRDPYAATHFEPGCAECDSLWGQLRAANDAPDWQDAAEQVTASIQAHAREAHDITLGPAARRSPIAARGAAA